MKKLVRYTFRTLCLIGIVPVTLTVYFSKDDRSMLEAIKLSWADYLDTFWDVQ